MVVKDSAGGLITGAEVSVTRSGSEIIRQRTNENAEVVVTLTSGEYEITATHLGFDSVATNLHVQPPSPALLSITMRPREPQIIIEPAHPDVPLELVNLPDQLIPEARIPTSDNSSKNALQPTTAPMLEIHVNTSKWVNGCLELTIERVNTSSQAIYIPEWEGTLFFLSTNLIHNNTSKKNEDVWLPIYGLSDMVNFDAHPLGAGAKITDHFCLPETSAVVNEQRKTRRQVALRGHVKIVASYFPNQEDWKSKKAEKETQLPTPWPPPSASLLIGVPCSPQSQCATDCKAPPVIMEGERTVIPDVYEFHKNWNDRGKTLADALSRQYPPLCKD